MCDYYLFNYANGFHDCSRGCRINPNPAALRYTDGTAAQLHRLYASKHGIGIFRMQ